MPSEHKRASAKGQTRGEEETADGDNTTTTAAGIGDAIEDTCDCGVDSDDNEARPATGEAATENDGVTAAESAASEFLRTPKRAGDSLRSASGAACTLFFRRCANGGRCKQTM